MIYEQGQFLRTYLLKAKWLLPVLLLALLAWSLLSPVLVSAYAGLGGYISEKMLGGATIDSLYLGNTAAGPTVVASGPDISTTPATAVAWPDGGVTTATLHGTISSLNGLPQTTYYFQWGYDPGALVNTTASVTTAVLGGVTATITGYDPGSIVYYRFVAGTDGTSYGTVISFSVAATGGHATGYFLLWNILTLIVVAGMIISTLMLVHNPIASLVLIIMGMITIVIIRLILGV